uniref:DUF6464 family protein n=1 Tax=Desertifilum tharense IPPAS B-1220 TaxID=1781255 RepID=A0ACD5GPM7_9CYAN
MVYSPLISLWMMHKAEGQGRERLANALEIAAYRRRYAQETRFYALPPECESIEGVGIIIGDLSCRFNARSAYLRCAVNPSGPCQGCPYYQGKDEEGCG